MSSKLLRLRALSFSLGQNLDWVQGAGGNTSVKTDSILWVKASGAWLSKADAPESFVAIDRAASMAQQKLILAEPSTARPSIETWLHMNMPHPWVTHTHPLSVLVWACQQDARAQLSARLEGLPWCFVPYTKPGKALADAVQAARADSQCPIIILENHGLVIGADSPEECLKWQILVDNRLSIAPRLFSMPARAALKTKLAIMPDYRMPFDDSIHTLAFDAFARQTLVNTYVFPDAVVFLHHLVHLYPDNAKTRVVLCPEEGVLVHKSLSDSAEHLLRLSAQLFQRLSPQTPLKILTQTQREELLDWDAEKWRQQQNKSKEASCKS